MQYQIPQVQRQIDQGAANQQTHPVPQVNQPDLASYSALQRSRYIVSAPVHVHQGATNQQLHPVMPGISLVALLSWESPRQVSRYIVAAPTHLNQGATLQQTFPVFKTNQLEPAWWYRTDINRAHLWEGPEQQIDGATPQQTYIFPVNQPQLNRIADVVNQNRRIVDAVKRFEGATVQQLYIFQPNQPELTAFSLTQRNRWITEATKRLENTVVFPQTYIFPVNQPNQQWLSAALPSPRFIVNATTYFTGATVQQTHLFPLSQPTSAYYLRTFIPSARIVVDSAPPQTDVFAINQPMTAGGRLRGIWEMLRAWLHINPIPPPVPHSIHGIRFVAGSARQSRAFMTPPKPRRGVAGTSSRSRNFTAN